MNKALEHIDAAYAWLSKVQVSAENVDFLAMARQELRYAKSCTAADTDIKEVDDG